MPKIPLYEYQEKPAESSKPFTPSIESLGRTEEAAITGLGEVSKRAEQYQREQNALLAAETLGKLNDREREFMSAELQKKGETAVGATTRGTEFYEQSVRDLSGTLRGDSARMFNLQSMQVRDAGLNRLSSHEAQQHQARKQDVIETRVNQIRDMIRNGADQDSIDRAVRDGELSLMGMIDKAYEGLDMSTMKSKLRDELFGEYLADLAVKDPSKIVSATDKWHGLMETTTLNKHLQKVDMANAITSLHKNPEAFRASDYESLDPTQQAHLQEQAQRLTETRLNKRIHEYERFERDRERAEKKQKDVNEVAAIILYDQGKISIGEIQEMALNRKLSGEALRRFMDKEQEGVDDPEVVGNLATQIEQKVDVSEQLREAWLRGAIKPKTYIEFKKQIGNDKYWKGLTKLKAIEPGPFDKFNADKNLKWEEAFTYFNRLISGNMDPEEAADTVLDGHFSKVRRSVSTLPKPRFWTGGDNMMDRQAVTDTINNTNFEYTNGRITETVYDHEIKNLRTLLKTIEEYERINGARQSGGTGTTSQQQQRKPEKNRPAY